MFFFFNEYPSIINSPSCCVRDLSMNCISKICLVSLAWDFESFFHDPFHSLPYYISIYVYVLLWICQIKPFQCCQDLWIYMMKIWTHSLIVLSSKFWYHLLTMALSLLRILEIINKLLMRWWKARLVKRKTEILEPLDFIH